MTVLKIDNTVDNTQNILKRKTFLRIKPSKITRCRKVYKKSKMPMVTRNNREDIYLCFMSNSKSRQNPTDLLISAIK